MRKPTSIRLPEDLDKVIKERARYNHRSISSEISYLIEVGLAAKKESGRDMIHLLDQLSQCDKTSCADA